MRDSIAHGHFLFEPKFLADNDMYIFEKQPRENVKKKEISVFVAVEKVRELVTIWGRMMKNSCRDKHGSEAKQPGVKKRYIW